MNRKYLFGIGILILVSFMGFFVWRHTKNSHQNITRISPKSSMKPIPKEVTITLDKNGFSPTTVTIKVGSAIRWINKSGSQETVNSDNYPTNKLHRELNFGVFNNGSSVVYIFTKPGNYGYHNQFHHEQKGEVIVEK